LNFLSLLSGIATRTQAFVKKVKPFRVKILDTRKTLPGLRILEKYAVRVGGGFNHRFRLDDQVLIKENHIDIAGFAGIKEGLKAIRDNLAEVAVEIEVRDLKEFKDAFLLRPDIIMLDNMGLTDIRKAVKLKNKLSLNIKLEASGNINIDNIAAYASTGIDFISLGTLTKDIDALDFSLEIT
jgi:nicotinate-nucleotide pyrophosphorylase (carboxylating)